MRITALISLAALGCAGCSYTFHDRTSFAPVSLATEDARPFGGWNPDTTVATAEATWLYAQLANNAYDRQDRTGVLYDLGPNVSLLTCREDPHTGMDYAVFEVHRASGRTETVIAFRGTQFTHWNDWSHGNFTGRQNGQGLLIHDQWREHIGPGADLSVTGHSLGGGIATHISLNRRNVSSYVFNSSPVFWREGAGEINARRSVVENGEILALFRLPGQEPTQIWTQLGCTSDQHTVEQHSISRLAHCLTLIAAYRSADAEASVCRNSMRYPASWRTRQPTCASRPTPARVERPVRPLPTPLAGSQPCRHGEPASFTGR